MPGLFVHDFGGTCDRARRRRSLVRISAEPQSRLELSHCLARHKVYGAMTSLTLRLRPLPTHPLHLGVRVSGQEAGNHGVEKDECERAADAVCDSSFEWAGEDGGAVPGGWPLAADGIFVAAPLPAGAKLHGAARAEPASASQPAADAGGEGRTGGRSAPA